MGREQPVFRFAPSPNGELHLGHAYSALLNQAMARRAGGRLLLRIEDIDPLRSLARYEAAILEDLTWLGMEWEEPVLRQSDNLGAYGEALARLDGLGLVYPAFMSRSELAAATDTPDWPRDPDGAPHYPSHDRNLPEAEVRSRKAAGRPFALRLRMDQAAARGGALSWSETGAGPGGETGRIDANPLAWGDVVLARRDVATSYHLSVVVDDAHQGVSDIVRGHDLFHATSVHVLVQKLLGYRVPRYHHHRLLLNERGAKLSKRYRDATLRELRQAGSSARDLRLQIGL
jgi:glutamyl-Q tRNA(Asp) synthetase